MHRVLVQNFILIWLDANIDESDSRVKQTIIQLRQAINTIDLFTNSDQCINFLNQVKDEQVFMIVSDSFGQQLVPLISKIQQVYSIYVLCENKANCDEWTKEWSKVKGIFSDVDLLCETLRPDTQQCDRDLTSVSITSSDLNHLESTFMYTQLFKEALLKIEYDDKAKIELVEFWRDIYHNDVVQMKLIDEFEQDYHLHKPIWWYTRQAFVYEILNRALRIQEVEIIIKMGFFIRDLHRQIEHLHSHAEHHDFLTVYRGQGMFNEQFDKIKETVNGLLTFNNFLSTSRDRLVSLCFAESSKQNPQLTGILFIIIIDPAVSSTPFAELDHESFFADQEKEILFSMHTIFRIGQITLIEERLWEVELTLISDHDDQELKRLTNHMRHETRGTTGWHQLSQMLYRTGNFDKAEEIYQMLLEKTKGKDQYKSSYFYQQLGTLAIQQANYHEALNLYQKSLKISEQHLSLNHPSLAITYNHIASIHHHLGEYSNALQFYQKALEIEQETLPLDRSNLSGIYNNIASTYDDMGEYSQALEFYEKALEIRQETLPSIHPDLANTYGNIASVYQNMGTYSKALEFYQKAMNINEKSLPPNHPSLATSYGNVALVHDTLGEHSKALEFYHKVLEIQQKTLPENHSNLATTYNNIGLIHSNMGEYAKALEFHQKALEIKKQSLPPNHPHLATIYSNIGGLYENMQEYSKALEFYNKTLEIFQNSLPPNHPHFATVYNNIAEVYDNMNNHSKALEFYQKSLEMQEKTHSSYHPIIANTYSNIASFHYKMREYLKALEFYQKALDIKQNFLPAAHPDLAVIYNNMGMTQRHGRIFESDGIL